MRSEAFTFPVRTSGSLLSAALAGGAVGAIVYVVAAGALTAAFGPGTFAGRVLSSWINLLTLAAFGAAVGQLLVRRASIAAEMSHFGVELLGGEPDTLLLPEDVQSARKQLNQLPAEGRASLPVRLLAAGLQRAKANWSSIDVAAAIKQQAELVQDATAAAYANVRYLAWAIPTIGFIGTVLGIGQAMGAIGAELNEATGVSPLQMAATHLHTAFDTTFVALVLSLVVMFLLHRVEADDDQLLVRATDWSMQRLPLRMHVSKGG